MICKVFYDFEGSAHFINQKAEIKISLTYSQFEKSRIKSIPTISTKKPTNTISFTLICPLEKAMVFGAVAMGSINPKEAASAAGISKSLGSIAVTS